MSAKPILAAVVLTTLVLATSIHAQEGNRQTVSPAGVASTAQRYSLGPGDVLEIKVFAQPDLSVNAQIDGDGNLSTLPFLGPIKAKCRTEKEIQSDIAAAYTRLVKSPEVSVRIIERNSHQPATVFGAVRQAAKLQVQRPLRLNELIAAAGGFSENAAGTIQVVHTEPVMCPGPGEEQEKLPSNETQLPMQVVRIAELRAGTPRANPLIRPGDLVFVAEAEPVYITGSVVSPSGIRLTAGLTLTRALGMVGGARREANLSEIRISRQKPGSSEQELFKVNYAAIKQNRQPDVLLMAYDVVEVSENGVFSAVNLKDLVLGILTGGLRNAIPSRLP